MIKVLSLFDGISCGRVALQRANIPVKFYIASEIDKFAKIVTHHNWSQTIQLDDVVIVRKMAEANVFGQIDLLIGGSPCQGFSFAGKQLAFDDPRSSLFFEYAHTLNALRKHNPNIKFLLENVKMKKEHLDVITYYLGVQPVLINSALVSAQNRQRYYWANWSISQPADRGIYLRDIIESGAVDREKSYCIDANYYKGGSVKNYMEKCNALTSMQNSSMVKFHQSEQRLMVRIGQVNEGGIGDRIYSPEGKSITLTAQSGGTAGNGNMLIGDKITYRKLTPVECERLQTLPDNYTALVSNSQRYRQLGNGWTVDVIAHILGEMPL